MLKIHHLNRSRSTRIIWLAEELGLPYEIVNHERDATTRLAPPSLGQVHPLNKAPVIEHGDLVIAESGASLEYLLDQVPNNDLRPANGTPQYYQYLEWLHFAEGSFAMPVIVTMIMNLEERDGTKPLDGYIAKELHLDVSYVEATLGERKYFAGDQFTAADVMMATTLQMASGLGLLDGKPNIARYLGDIQNRPAFQKAAAFG